MTSRTIYSVEVEVDTVDSDGDSFDSDLFGFGPTILPTPEPLLPVPAVCPMSPDSVLLATLEADLDHLTAAGPFDTMCQECWRHGVKRRRT